VPHFRRLSCGVPWDGLTINDDNKKSHAVKGNFPEAPREDISLLRISLFGRKKLFRRHPGLTQNRPKGARREFLVKGYHTHRILTPHYRMRSFDTAKDKTHGTGDSENIFPGKTSKIRHEAWPGRW
jgi:hypothetical protein